MRFDTHRAYVDWEPGRLLRYLATAWWTLWTLTVVRWLWRHFPGPK